MNNVSILNVCFHGIGTPRRALEPGEESYWVGTRQFTAILDEVAGWGNTRLSFDDGNASDVEIALPALAERGLSADFFLLAGRLGAPGSVDADGVRTLRSLGMAIGTHGMRHRPWRGMDAHTRHEELVEARARLAAAAGSVVDAASCPLGCYDRRLLADLRRLGYQRVYTSDRRPARRNAWLQPRFSVRHDDTPETLRAALLTRPTLRRRVRSGAVTLVKRWR
jgi:peptidoglycan/xylan/chitin deacetylase (PgdA/CDA1 family)